MVAITRIYRENIKDEGKKKASSFVVLIIKIRNNNRHSSITQQLYMFKYIVEVIGKDLEKCVS